MPKNGNDEVLERDKRMINEINENYVIQTAIGLAIQMVGIPVVVHVTVYGNTYTIVIDR
jgi:hypothetical protein